jgi:hypothetical protein
MPAIQGAVSTVEVDFGSIPRAMKGVNRWLLWRFETRDGKQTKVPYQSNGEKASSTSTPTWTSFDAVMTAYNGGGYSGIGFALGDGWAGVDFDHKVKDGTIAAETIEDLKFLDSYSEFSPSDEGIHTICYGELPEAGRKNQAAGIEIYASGRYFTVTGRRVADYPAEPQHRTEELLKFYKKYFIKPEPKQELSTGAKSTLSDDQIISLAAGAKSGGKFISLMAGSTAGYPSASEADEGLAFILAFYTDDPAQILRIISRSLLWDEKWQREDYQARTIGNALRMVTEHYSGDAEAKAEVAQDQKGQNGLIDSPCDVHELLGVFKKWLHIEEDYNIIGPTCATIANFCRGDPDIIGLIQPSGSIKTEFIRSLGQSENQYVYPLSSITEHTLVSGHKDSKDLVPLLRGRMICIKDFTTLLSKKEDVRSQIFADLRELTDGYIQKEFGNGIKKQYQGIHSSILFASTNAIEKYYSMYSNLGQRLIFLRPKNDPKAARERSFKNREKQEPMRAELHQVMMRFLATYVTKAQEGLPRTPDEILEEIGSLYDFLAVVRAPIHHDFRSGEIDELPEPEFPTRIANTIGRLIEVHALIHERGEVGIEDMAFGRRVVCDNIPTMRWRVLSCLSTKWMSTPTIAKEADLSGGAVRYALDELFCLKLVDKLTREEKIVDEDRRSDSYKLTDETAAIIEKLRTSIRGEGTTQEQHTNNLDKQNTVKSNPCPLFSTDDVCGLGLNPSKGPRAVLVRFLADQPRILGEDLRHPGETRPYGPFSRDDIATLPAMNAEIFIQKGFAVQVNT